MEIINGNIWVLNNKNSSIAAERVSSTEYVLNLAKR